MSSKRSKAEFDYAGRAAEVEAAQLAVTETFAKLVDRTNRRDPATRTWLDAIARFRGAIELRLAHSDEGVRRRAGWMGEALKRAASRNGRD